VIGREELHDEVTTELAVHGAHVRLLEVRQPRRLADAARDLAARERVDGVLRDLGARRVLPGRLVQRDAERERAHLVEAEDDDGARHAIHALAGALVDRRVHHAQELRRQGVVAQDLLAELRGRGRPGVVGLGAHVRHVADEGREVAALLHRREEAVEQRSLAHRQGRGELRRERAVLRVVFGAGGRQGDLGVRG
jgi:hypothetical protein